MFVIYNVNTLYVKKHAETLAGAKRSALALNKKTIKSGQTYSYATREEYDALDIEVDTYNMMDPDRKVVKIKKSLKGTNCDPAIEAYWST